MTTFFNKFKKSFFWPISTTHFFFSKNPAVTHNFIRVCEKMPKYRKINNDPVPRKRPDRRYKFKNKISSIRIVYFQDRFVRVRTFSGNIKDFVIKDIMSGHSGFFSKSFKSLRRRFSSSESYKIY